MKKFLLLAALALGVTTASNAQHYRDHRDHQDNRDREIQRTTRTVRIMEPRIVINPSMRWNDGYRYGARGYNHFYDDCQRVRYNGRSYTRCVHKYYDRNGILRTERVRY